MIKIPPFKNIEDVEIWPVSNQFKRKAPGLCVAGRRWERIGDEDVPVLIGDILRDISLAMTLVLVRVTGHVLDDGQVYCNIGILDVIEDEMPVIHAVPAMHLPYYLRAACIGSDSKRLPVMDLKCHRDGIFWEDMPRDW